MKHPSAVANKAHTLVRIGVPIKVGGKYWHPDPPYDMTAGCELYLVFSGKPLDCCFRGVISR